MAHMQAAAWFQDEKVWFRGQSGRVREGPNRSVISQIQKFTGVEIPSAEGPESTQIGHSSSLMRTSAYGSQSGRPCAATSGQLIARSRHADAIPMAWILWSLVVSLLGEGERAWNAGLPPFFLLMWLAIPASWARTRRRRFGEQAVEVAPHIQCATVSSPVQMPSGRPQSRLVKYCVGRSGFDLL